MEIRIKRRNYIQRLIRLPKMWYMQNKQLKGVDLLDRLWWFYCSAKIVLKK